MEPRRREKSFEEQREIPEENGTQKGAGKAEKLLCPRLFCAVQSDSAETTCT